MKKWRVLGICLTLLILIMTACGHYEDAAQGTSQGYEASVQGQTSEPGGSGEDVSAALQGYETEVQEQTLETERPMEDAPEALQQEESKLQEPTPESEDFRQDTANDNLPAYGNYYYDLTNVVLYLEVYDELPPNYITKSEAQSLGWEGGSVEKYLEGAAIGGDTFGNREGLLPKAAGRGYTECDIDTNGYSSRGSRRLVFSNDGLYFYTSDHYESFSEVTVTEDYEVIW